MTIGDKAKHQRGETTQTESSGDLKRTLKGESVCNKVCTKESRQSEHQRLLRGKETQILS